jgi:hypothetical protein
MSMAMPDILTHVKHAICTGHLPNIGAALKEGWSSKWFLLSEHGAGSLVVWFGAQGR